MGGDLAYVYGLTGTLAGVGLDTAQQTLAAPEFGVLTQAINKVLEGGDGSDHLAAGTLTSLSSGGGGEDDLLEAKAMTF